MADIFLNQNNNDGGKIHMSFREAIIDFDIGCNLIKDEIFLQQNFILCDHFKMIGVSSGPKLVSSLVFYKRKFRAMRQGSNFCPLSVPKFLVPLAKSR